MRIINSILICLLSCLPLTVHADDRVFLLGAEDRTCTRWIAEREAGGHAVDDDVSWILGFYSGYNAFAPGPRRFFLYQDAQNLLGVIDRYCAEDPSISIAEAAIRFLKRLKVPLQ